MAPGAIKGLRAEWQTVSLRKGACQVRRAPGAACKKFGRGSCDSSGALTPISALRCRPPIKEIEYERGPQTVARRYLQLASVALVGISWAMVVVNVVINIRNGQRLSIDDYGWLMNGVIVGTLSVAPTAATGFAGYRFARGRWGWAIFAPLVAIPLVGWSSWR